MPDWYLSALEILDELLDLPEDENNYARARKILFPLKLVIEMLKFLC